MSKCRVYNLPRPFHGIAELLQLVNYFEQILGSAEDSERLVEEVAEAFPNLINLIWHVGLYMVEGREIVETIQNIYTAQERPIEHEIGQSFRALTGDWYGTCPVIDEPGSGMTDVDRPDPFPRRIAGHDYVLPADQALAFVDEIFERARPIRSGPDALVLIISIRFTQQTRATLGMQQFPLSAHVEVLTIAGLNGNERMMREITTLAETCGAIPHWGQFHSDRHDFIRLFGRRRSSGRTNAQIWADAMNTIARRSDGNPNTFRHAFAREKGLLADI